MSGLGSSAAYRRLGGAYRFRAQLRPGFSFTTALPPAAALAIRLLKNSSIERRQLHERAALLRRRLMPQESCTATIRAISCRLSSATWYCARNQRSASRGIQHLHAADKLSDRAARHRAASRLIQHRRTRGPRTAACRGGRSGGRDGAQPHIHAPGGRPRGLSELPFLKRRAHRARSDIEIRLSW
jgi:hypothetical protein